MSDFWTYLRKNGYTLLGKSFLLVKVFTNLPLVRSRQLSGQNGTLMLRGGHAGDFLKVREK